MMVPISSRVVLVSLLSDVETIASPRPASIIGHCAAAASASCCIVGEGRVCASRVDERSVVAGITTLLTMPFGAIWRNISSGSNQTSMVCS